MTLHTSDIDQLEELLFAEDLAEEALDYFGLHGLVCASLVGPKKLDREALFDVIFSGQTPKNRAEQLTHLETCIAKIADNMNEAFSEGIEPALPYEAEEEADACLESWCIGFIEGFLYQEEAWFENDEEVAAELLLPIMAMSGLFENDEFEEIRRNDKLMSQFETIIPDQLTSIFLYYHAK